MLICTNKTKTTKQYKQHADVGASHIVEQGCLMFRTTVIGSCQLRNLSGYILKLRNIQIVVHSKDEFSDIYWNSL